MIRSEWRGFGEADGKKLLNCKRLHLETVADVKAHVAAQARPTGKIKVLVAGFEAADEDRIDEVLQVADSLLVEHADPRDPRAGWRPLAEEEKPAFVRCIFVDTYIDKRGEREDPDLASDLDLQASRSSKRLVAARSHLHASPVATLEPVRPTLQYPQVQPVPQIKNNYSQQLKQKNGKVSTTEKSSDDASSSANPQPVELPLKKSKTGILDYGTAVSSFFDKPPAKQARPESLKSSASLQQTAPVPRTAIQLEPIPPTVPAPAKPLPVQPAQNKKPQNTSTYFVKSKPLLPLPKEKKAVETESSDDDSSLDLPDKKKQPAKPQPTHPTDSAPAAAGKKVNLNFKVLEPKKPSPLDGYEEVCLDSLKELADAEASKLLHEGLQIYYKVLEMDEEGWDLRLSRDYIQGVVTRFGSGILTVDIVKGGQVASSDEMHIDVVYDLLVSRESEKHKELLDRVVKRSKDAEEMREHKEKYRQLAEVDQSMSEQEKNISHQVNYYFGDKNYFKDKFIQNHLDHDEDKAFSIELLLNFNKIKEFSKDLAVIESALRKFESSSMCTFKFVEGKKKIYKKSVSR